MDIHVGPALPWVVFLSLVPVILCSLDQQNITYQTKYFDTLLDHFSFTTNRTFKLRYLENDTYWKKDENGPIFFYTGNEGDITMFANNTGFMWEKAPLFNALLIFAEHRYYGESLPFGNLSFSEPKYSGYLSSSQALADYVALISYIKESYGATGSPVIAFGGSYGGMLAAWMRMKYPAVIQGSLASSAPIWQFTGMTPCWAFNRVASSAYSTVSEGCAISIKNSWTFINKKGSTDDGREWLTKNFNLCKPLKTSEDIQALKDWLNEVYINLAMTNYPYPTNFLAPLPANPIKAMCKYLLNPVAKDEVILKNIFNAVSVYFNGTGNVKCLDVNDTASESLGQLGWDYQSCTEMVMPMCDDGKTDMFEESKWDIEKVTSDCYKKFKVKPQVHLVEQEYGGKNINWASNIIFSNGLLDPWASGGVLKNVSNTAVAVIIPESAHHLDLRFSNAADPYSVIAARKFYKNTISRWILQHKIKQ